MSARARLLQNTAILSIAMSAKFSGDRANAEYAKEIWNTVPLLTELA